MLIQVSPPLPSHLLPISHPTHLQPYPPYPPYPSRYLAVHILGSARLNAPGIKHVRLIAFEAVRARLITTWATHASEVIPASSWSAGPVVGPLLCGAIGGCGGLFLSGGGLKAVKAEIPWAVESVRERERERERGGGRGEMEGRRHTGIRRHTDTHTHTQTQCGCGYSMHHRLF